MTSNFKQQKPQNSNLILKASCFFLAYSRSFEIDNGLLSHFKCILAHKTYLIAYCFNMRVKNTTLYTDTSSGQLIKDGMFSFLAWVMTEKDDKSICEGREECADFCLLSCKGMHGKRRGWQALFKDKDWSRGWGGTLEECALCSSSKDKGSWSKQTHN